jgi:hypothetical protein
MKVRKLDDGVYIVYYDGDLIRAYHSDIAETPFASVQDLNSNDRKYAYVVWKLSDDGKHLSLRNVNPQSHPKRNQGFNYRCCAFHEKRAQPRAVWRGDRV